MKRKNSFFQKTLFLLVLTVGFNTSSFAQKIVHYELTVKDTFVNFTGKTKRAITVNGQIPMPTLRFTEGDTAEIVVHNTLNESTSLHWHGLFLPNKEDGVPYLTQMPIKAHATYTYRFPIIQNGTHWYHSHSGLQEQIGLYGSMILNKKKNDKTIRKGIDDIITYPLILSEWTDLNPHQIHRSLHNATDWFAIQKGSTQSYSEAIRHHHFRTKIKNEWKRMNAMDVSDVYYNQFLINGKTEQQLSEIKGGETVRLQISNGGASTNFWMQYAGGKITVVANDGNDVEPVEVDRLLIAVAETYDIIVTKPNDSIAYELLVTAEDRTKSASLFLGKGIKQLANPLPKLNYFEGMKMMNGMMKMNGHLDDMGMQMSLNKMDMNDVMYQEITGKHNSTNQSENELIKTETLPIKTLNYSLLKSTNNTTLPQSKYKELRFELTGNMNRYVWSLNNKVVSEADKILIKKGENVRIIIYNGSMMRHPMHLHGHDFRLLNGQGDYAPLKNTVDLMPMETDTLEFNANATGNWFFHCHILYHMMSGMGRVLRYENAEKNPEIPNEKQAQQKLFWDDRKPHFMFINDFATNGNDGMLMLSNTRWMLHSDWRLGYMAHHGYEVETHLGRYFGRNQFLYGYLGYDFRYRKTTTSETNLFGEIDTKDNRQAICIGAIYTLPMLLKFECRLDNEKKIRLQLMRDDIPLSKRLRFSAMINTDKEYMTALRYILTKNTSIRIHYDSDMSYGLGVTFSY